LFSGERYIEGKNNMTEKLIEDLAVQAAEGDMDALEKLVQQVHGHLFSFLRLLSVPETDLDSVAQDVVIQMHRSLTSFDPENPFLPWLRGIARHVVGNFWRSHEKERKNLGAFKEYIIEKFSSAHKAGSYTEHVIKSCIERLKEKQRTMISMRYAKGLKSVDIAKNLGMKAVTVRQGLSRIREALKACIEAHS
jgi:RNA polymerase sigma-70 factor (ECF subfamily)